MKASSVAWLALLVSLGCKPNLREKVERFAGEINPILAAMKPRAAAIKRELRRPTPQFEKQYDDCRRKGGDIVPCGLEACGQNPDEAERQARINRETFTSVEHDLDRLRLVQYFNPGDGWTEWSYVSYSADFLLGERSSCDPPEPPGHEPCDQIVLCRSASSANWHVFFEIVRRLHEHAKALGVDIVSFDE